MVIIKARILLERLRAPKYCVLTAWSHQVQARNRDGCFCLRYQPWSHQDQLGLLRTPKTSKPQNLNETPNPILQNPKNTKPHTTLNPQTLKTLKPQTPNPKTRGNPYRARCRTLQNPLRTFIQNPKYPKPSNSQTLNPKP